MWEELLEGMIEGGDGGGRGRNGEEVKMVLVRGGERLKEVRGMRMGSFMWIVNVVENGLLKLIVKGVMGWGYG